MKALFAIALLAAAALGGCATLEEIQARQDAADDAQCQSFGAKPQTEGYSKCRKDIAAARAAQASAEVDARQAQIRANQAEDEARMAAERQREEQSRREDEERQRQLQKTIDDGLKQLQEQAQPH